MKRQKVKGGTGQEFKADGEGKWLLKMTREEG